MSECKLNLEKCDSYCNEKQVFPAMRYFIEKMDLPVNAAAKEVYNFTAGMVTQSRAREVWRNRTVRLGKQPTEEENKPETEENQEVATEPDSVEVNKEIAKQVSKGTSKFIRAEVKKEREKIKREAVKVEPPTGKYQVIYADPPWKYGDEQTTNERGAAARHYPSMTITELCELEINSIALDDAVLFLWTTSPLLEDSFKVIKAWGFKYKSSFVWDKIKHNMGHYNSVRHEFLLISTKGSCTPDNLKLFDSVQSIERTAHSKKPNEFRTIIETLYEGNKIQLFARDKYEGWENWGNEV